MLPAAKKEAVGDAVEHFLVDHIMNFISQIDGNDQRNHAQAQKFKEFCIVKAFFIIVEHEYQVQDSPYGSHIGTEGILIPEGGYQVYHQQGTAGSKHAMNDAGPQKNRDGDPVRQGGSALFENQALQRCSYDNGAVRRGTRIWGFTTL